MTEPNGVEITAAIEGWARTLATAIRGDVDSSGEWATDGTRRWKALAAELDKLADEMRALRHEEAGTGAPPADLSNEPTNSDDDPL